jgi:hypothetical protein
MDRIRGEMPAGVVDAILGWAGDGTFPALREEALPEWYRLLHEARYGDLTVSVVVCADPAGHLLAAMGLPGDGQR